MRKTRYAFFVSCPRTMEDLRKPHPMERERPFEIVKTITLGAMDYENFTTDMLADRQFIEDNASLCSRGDVWKCLLIRKQGGADGVLVMPEDEWYVGYAAYLAEI